MAELTTTVSFDRNDDGTYELAAVAAVLNARIRNGRSADLSQGQAGTCVLTMDNSAGAYTPKGATTPLRPMHRVRVVSESQNIFTGFVRRTFLHPGGNQMRMTIDCADWLWVLSRIDVSQPLMRGVRSDIYAHRIADYAEVGEHVDNPRFRDDLAGYTDVGAATTARVTTGETLEGIAAAATSGAASAGDGWQYAIPHSADSEFQSKKVTAAAYVWADDSAQVGNKVFVRLADSVGNVATSADFALTNTPERITVTGTFNGAATDFYIRVLRSTTGGASKWRSGAVHAAFDINAIPRSFDEGRSRFAYVGPRSVNALAAIQEAAENELGGYLYVNGSGSLVFEDRHHRWRQTASRVSQGTVDETMLDAPYEEAAEDLIGLVELHYQQWEEGDAGTTVYSLFPLPRTIPGNGTLTLEIDYGAIVRDAIKPVANTDYKINRAPDGSGSDESGNVTLAFQDFGGGAQVTFTSSVAYATYLTELKIRGTPVRVATDRPQVSYTPTGAPVVASKLRFSYGLQSTEAHVSPWARYLGDRYVTQRERLPVSLVNKSAALLAQMTARVISERVTIRNDNTAYSAKVDGDYYIDANEHALDMGKTKLETIWQCVPVDSQYFLIGTDTIGGAALIAP